MKSSWCCADLRKTFHEPYVDAARVIREMFIGSFMGASQDRHEAGPSWIAHSPALEVRRRNRQRIVMHS